MKICPECININFVNESCAYCGFPLQKKILGNFEEFNFYDVIEKFNQGNISEAKNKLKLCIEQTPNNKLSILHEKITESDKYYEKANHHAKNAENYLRNQDFKSALNEIELALEINNNTFLIDLKNKIKINEIAFNNKTKALTYFEQGVIQIQSGEIENGLNNVKSALKLDAENVDFQNYFKQESERFIYESIQKIKLHISNRKQKDAQLIIDQIQPFISSEDSIKEFQEKIDNSKKNSALIGKIVKYLVYITISIIVGYFSWTFYYKYSEDQKWISFTKTAKIDDYKNYISQNTTSPYLKIAQDSLASYLWIDSITWSKYLNTINVENAQNYIKILTPIGGSHLLQAREGIDSLDWVNIESSNDPALYDQYIANHPQSKYLTLAKNKSASGVTQTEKQNILNIINAFFTAFSNKDIESIMNYFGPITQEFESEKNVTKADLMQKIQKEFEEKTENNFTIDNSSITIDKDKDYNFVVSINCDQKYMIYNDESEINEYASYQKYENAEYFFTITTQNKIQSIKHQTLSQSNIN